MHRFDKILRNPKGASAPWDRTLDESRSFIALPSLGSLVPGWMLIVPRRPVLNLASLTLAEWDELDGFQRRVEEGLEQFGGQVFSFEHGSRDAGGLLGCGVDQAHLHVVPLQFNLLNAATAKSNGEIDWTVRTGVQSFRTAVLHNSEYVSIVNVRTSHAAIGEVKRPQSQWIRRLIAEQLGAAHQWDYNVHPNASNLLETVTGYQPA